MLKTSCWSGNDDRRSRLVIPAAAAAVPIWSVADPLLEGGAGVMDTAMGPRGGAAVAWLGVGRRETDRADRHAPAVGELLADARSDAASGEAEARTSQVAEDAAGEATVVWNASLEKSNDIVEAAIVAGGMRVGSGETLGAREERRRPHRRDERTGGRDRRPGPAPTAPTRLSRRPTARPGALRRNGEPLIRRWEVPPRRGSRSTPSGTPRLSGNETTASTRWSKRQPALRRPANSPRRWRSRTPPKARSSRRWR